MEKQPPVVHHAPVPQPSREDKLLIDAFYSRVLAKDNMIQRLQEDLRDIPLSTAEGSTPTEGSTPATSPIDDKDWIGFLRGLQDHETFHMELDPASEYISSTEIHPLFRRENWIVSLTEDITSQAWEAMAPAFALATKYLTTPQLQPFWYHLAFGQPSYGLGDKRYLRRSPMERNPEAAQKSLEAMLLDMASKLKFWWSPQIAAGISTNGHLSPHWGGVVGQVLGGQEGRDIALRYPFKENAHYFEAYLGLSSRYLYYLLSPKSSARKDTCAMMRLQFAIAQTICHELAHAMYYYRGLKRPEVYIDILDGMAEAGFSWCYNTLGAIIRTSTELEITEESTCLVSLDWDSLFGSLRITRILSMRRVNAWFRKETWDRIDEVVQHDLLKLPSCTGIPGPHFWAIPRFGDGPSGLRYYTILHKDGEAIFPEWAVGKSDGPPAGTALQDWFFEVRRREKLVALTKGFTEKSFGHPHGGYRGRVRR